MEAEANRVDADGRRATEPARSRLAATQDHDLTFAGPADAVRTSLDVTTSEAANAAPWRAAGEHPALRPGDLHLWRYDLDSEAVAPPAAAILSGPELKRAAGLVFELDRRRFCAGRLALRQTLGLYLGCPAASLSLATRDDGKPYLVDCDIEFNVSHSQNEWICAIARGTPVGVDVEVLRAVPDCFALARHHFARAEADALAALPQERRELAFLTCWTRKEAYLKLLGLGVLADLDAFVAGLGPEEVTLASIAPGTAGNVHLRTFLPGPGVIGALGFIEEPRRVQYFVAPRTWIADPKLV
jgi:4'-phosphopantetheinyl transferase